ncbi:MAG: hypothetical protein NC930_05175 [Candidatus Omnitrophica bacterium]|nr:hypothetical protein [Candidatus Omnitrophota bacterium]
MNRIYQGRVTNVELAHPDQKAAKVKKWLPFDPDPKAAREKWQKALWGSPVPVKTAGVRRLRSDFQQLENPRSRYQFSGGRVLRQKLFNLPLIPVPGRTGTRN